MRISTGVQILYSVLANTVMAIHGKLKAVDPKIVEIM
jgi:hypothetical protein